MVKLIAPPFVDDAEVIAAREALEKFRMIAAQFYGEASTMLESGITDRDSLFAFGKSITQATHVVSCSATIQKALVQAQDLTAIERRSRGKRGHQNYLEAHYFYLPQRS